MRFWVLQVLVCTEVYLSKARTLHRMYWYFFPGQTLQFSHSPIRDDFSRIPGASIPEHNTPHNESLIGFVCSAENELLRIQHCSLSRPQRSPIWASLSPLSLFCSHASLKPRGDVLIEKKVQSCIHWGIQGEGGPKISSKSCSFQGILRENPAFFSKF